MGKGALIAGVSPGSIADELGLEPGDRVLAVNSQEPEDLIDYRFLCADEYLELSLLKENGEEWLLEIEKDYDDDLGIIFERATFDGIKRCQNRCLFCFVDQMPPGMRETLYIKDDDYRMSFLQGNFVTLTNLKEEELKRITGMRLSPLYISVHTTNPELRRRLLNNPRAGRIMGQLEQLAAAGIAFHTQIVLCPGINDGRELARTLADLTTLGPSLLSVAIVPVGLTQFRQGLFPLREFTRGEARELVGLVDRWQEANLAARKDPLVYLADEFYLLAGEPFPPVARYGDFLQLENGVGLVRLFLDEFAEVRELLPGELPRNRKITLVTGVSGGQALAPVFARLRETGGLDLQVRVIENRYFGPSVTVAGLLTGQDLLEELQDQDLGELLIIPGAMLRPGENTFLDGLTMEDLVLRLGTQVAKAATPRELVELIIRC